MTRQIWRRTDVAWAQWKRSYLPLDASDYGYNWQLLWLYDQSIRCTTCDKMADVALGNVFDRVVYYCFEDCPIPVEFKNDDGA